MFRAESYHRMHDRFFKRLAEPVTFMVNNGTGFDEYPTKAVIRGYVETDLVPDGPIQMGDVKVMVAASDFPEQISRPLERKDRIVVGGRPCAVMHFDENTRNIKGEVIMFVIGVRG